MSHQHVTFACGSPQACLPGAVSQTVLAFVTLTVLSAGQAFCRMPLSGALSDVMITLGLWLLRMNFVEVLCHSQHFNQEYVGLT